MIETGAAYDEEDDQVYLAEEAAASAADGASKAAEAASDWLSWQSLRGVVLRALLGGATTHSAVGEHIELLLEEGRRPSVVARGVVANGAVSSWSAKSDLLPHGWTQEVRPRASGGTFSIYHGVNGLRAKSREDAWRAAAMGDVASYTDAAYLYRLLKTEATSDRPLWVVHEAAHGQEVHLESAFPSTQPPSAFPRPPSPATSCLPVLCAQSPSPAASSAFHSTPTHSLFHSRLPCP